jgi:hypothetical protein
MFERQTGSRFADLIGFARQERRRHPWQTPLTVSLSRHTPDDTLEA